MDKFLKMVTGIFGALATIACLSTVGIIGYALAGGDPDKAPEEVNQTETQTFNEEMQKINMPNENPLVFETPMPLHNEHVHNYIESIDIKADCYQEGRLKYTCDICGDIYYIDIPMIGHRSDDGWTVKREATSDLVGLRVKYCIYCDQIVEIEDIPYTSEKNSVTNESHIHNYISTIEREPTCVLAGLRRYTCSCGSLYTEPIHASGHVASDWVVAEEATTTYKGTEQRMCRVCGVLLDSRPIDKKQESESLSNTATITPTATPRQTSTPLPTNAPRPTSVPTQSPTATPRPINTPRPTAAPTVRPTSTPTVRPTNTPTPPKEESYEIYRDENVVISFAGITGDENYYDVNLIVENRSSRSITVQVRETSINGIMVNPVCSIEVAPGKKAFGSMGIIGKDATNVPKSQVTNVETKIHIFDWKDENFGYDTENIVILPYNATNTPRPTAKPTNIPTARPTPTSPVQSVNYSIGKMTFYTYDDNSYYRFIQPITNTGNVPLCLKKCTLDIEDENGHLLSTESFISNCPDVISPGETGYFYNGLGSTSTNDAVKNASSIVAVPKLEIVESDEEPITYQIWDISFTQGDFLPSVVGRITNNTREDDSLVYVQAIFYGKNGNVIYITGTNIMNLLAGQTQSFNISILPTSDKNISYENIANYEVIARKSHYQF